MYTIENEIKELGFEGLQIAKLVTEEQLDILAISLEKESVFPEHTSPRKAHLIVLEGDIEFRIDGRSYKIGKGQRFNFPSGIKHSVFASQDSKFLIIR